MSKPLDPDKFPPANTTDIYVELGRRALDVAREGLERRRNDIENIKLLLSLPRYDPTQPSTITINGKPYDPHRDRS